MPPVPAPRAPTIAPPDRETRKPAVRFPAGACDCHAHVFGPQTRYPFLPDAGYIAPDALPSDYVRMLTTVGCARAVLVQPSVYGTDNRCMLDAMRSGAFDFRGIAVIDPGVTDRELEDMHRAGVRGVRINLASSTSGPKLDDAIRLAPRLKALGWHLQFFLDIKKTPEAEHLLASLSIPFVIDHFARVSAAQGLEAPPMQALLRLVRRENCWAKIMGPYFVSANNPVYDDVAPFARAVVSAAPDRVVWGSDWPHPSPNGPMPNDGFLADLLADWVPDEAQRRKLLVDNPARLYGF